MKVFDDRRKLHREILRHWMLYIMLVPCVVWFIIFAYVPMTGLLLAFKEFHFTKGILESPWVGFKYFENFFNYFERDILIRNTLVIGFFKTVVAFPFPVVFALMLNEVRSSGFKKLTQTVSYLPHFISWAVVAALLMRLLAPDTGLINQVKGIWGLDKSTFYLMEEKYFYSIMFFSHLWKTIGWDSIIYLAAISGINPELYEAAIIDGAKKLKQVWHITIPSIKFTMGIILIMSIGNIIKTGFEQVYLLRTPGNMRVADILDTYVIRVGIQQGEYGYATAIGLLTGLVALFMVIFTNKVCKKYFEVYIW